MRYTRSLAIATTVAFLAIGALAGTAQTTAAETPIPTPTAQVPTEPDQMAKTLTESRYERSMIEWVFGAFTEAGLDAPDVAIRFSASEDSCEGNRGTVRRRADGLLVARICASHPEPTIRDSWRRRTLVHEVAHVWLKTNLNEQSRNRFIKLRGLTAWNDRTGEWNDRAVEHAAEIMTWGLGDDTWKFATLPNQKCREMRAGYRVLTGRQPIRDSGDCL